MSCVFISCQFIIKSSKCLLMCSVPCVCPVQYAEGILHVTGINYHSRPLPSHHSKVIFMY